MVATVALAPTARLVAAATVELAVQVLRSALRLLEAKAVMVVTAAAPAMAVTVELVALPTQPRVPAGVVRAALEATASMEVTAVMAASVGLQSR